MALSILPDRVQCKNHLSTCVLDDHFETWIRLYRGAEWVPPNSNPQGVQEGMLAPIRIEWHDTIAVLEHVVLDTATPSVPDR